MDDDDLRRLWVDKMVEDVTATYEEAVFWIRCTVECDSYNISIEDVKTDLRENGWATEEELNGHQ